MKETDFQTLIRKSLERQGGFGRKWASEWHVGPPDLILTHLEIGGPAFMEVKLIKEPSAKFNQKLNVTDKQHEYLGNLQKSGCVALVGVVVYWRRNRWDLVAVPVSNTGEYRLSSDYLQDDRLYRCNQNSLIDTLGLLQSFIQWKRRL